VHHRLGIGDVRHRTTQASAGNRRWWRAHPQRSLSLAGQPCFAKCPSHLVLSALRPDRVSRPFPTAHEPGARSNLTRQTSFRAVGTGATARWQGCV
jgi:hypothetical protein